MKTSGKLLQRTLSEVFLSRNIVLSIELIFLILLGALAMMLHAKLRIPLNIPGRHGLEFMALIALAGTMGRFRFSATIATTAAAVTSLIPFIGFTDPFMPAYYVLIGFVLDLLRNENKTSLVLFSLFAGLSYMIIPFARIFIHFFTEYPYMSFVKHGYIVPFLTHFAFGFAGGILGAGLIKTLENRLK